MKQQAIFRALADPSRRRILKLLQKGSMTAGELAHAFDFTQASLSHHFAVLKAADLVCTQRRGQNIVYSLNSTVFEDISRLMMNLFAVQEGREK
ncbi:MAG: autorepressor SdpR family transcription factor [Gammaproteobacteria bacterium]